MGALKKGAHEEFARLMARGDRGVHQCYLDAGYTSKNPKQSHRLAYDPRIVARIAELQERAALIDEMSTAKALEKACVTKLKIVEELKLIGFSRMDTFVSVTTGGDPFIDLSAVPKDEWAAVKEVVVDDYTEGRGEDARDVKRVRITLHSKKDALMALAGMHGMLPRGSGMGDTFNTQLNVYLDGEDARS